MKFQGKLRTATSGLMVDQTRMVRGCVGSLLICTATLFAAFGFGQNATAADLSDTPLADYQPGQGFHVPDTGLTVGGYLTGEYVEHTSPTITFSNASLLFWWENDSRLKLFSEVDFENGLNRQGSFQSDTGEYLSLERFYADYAVSDALTVRLGKFLTPIGRWNQIHADPLVWTTSRPLVTEVAFPTNATGLMLLGSSDLFGKPYDYAFYVASGDLDPSPNVDPFKRALGARVNVNLSDALQVGASAASFEQRSERGQNRNLVGVDFLYQSHGYELMSEALYRLSEHTPSGNDKGFYIQAVAPLIERLFAVYRFEVFHSAGEEPGGPVQPVAMLMGQVGAYGGAGTPPGPGVGPPPPTVRLNIVGLTYRFRPNLVGKIELVDGNHIGQVPAPVGVLTSLSVLF
jgi:hypothetical protein